MRKLGAIGALALCALGVCALGASSASATTFYVCEQAAGEEFDNSHCNSKSGGGKWTTRDPAAGTAKKVTPTNTNLFILEGFELGVWAGKVTCEQLKGSGKNTNFVDKGMLMQVEGKEMILEFGQCKVAEPAGFECIVKGGEFVTNKLSSLTETVAGVTKVKFTPESGELIGEVWIEKCFMPGINGNYKVIGTLKGIAPAANPASLEFTSTSGSSITFNSQPASFIVTTHLVEQGTEKTIAIK